MIDTNQLDQIVGQPVYDSEHDKIGTAGQVYVDDVTGKPEWVTVQTGLFGTKESLVPLADADLVEDGLSVPYAKGQVTDAPRVEADDGHLSKDQEAELYRHYGLGYSQAESDSGLPAGTDPAQAEQRSSGGVGDAMTRSEEQLNVGTQQVESGKARLRKYVVTEQETVTVPVTREEVRIEREPITDANRGEAMSGADISEDEQEVTLHEERPVVQKQAVPVERVNLAKDEVTEQQQVTEEVRREQIETEGDVGGGNARG